MEYLVLNIDNPDFTPPDAKALSGQAKCWFPKLADRGTSIASIDHHFSARYWHPPAAFNVATWQPTSTHVASLATDVVQQGVANIWQCMAVNAT
jgi:hypothetical protein